MSNEDTPSQSVPASRKSGRWDWLWPSIAAMVIVKISGAVGGLVTLGVYYRLKTRLGTRGAVAIATGAGVVTPARSGPSLWGHVA